MKVTIPETVLSTDLQNEAVLLNLETGEYFGLNEVGLSLWRLLSQGMAVEEARASLLAEYDVAEDVLTQDVNALLQSLAERKLVTLQET